MLTAGCCLICLSLYNAVKGKIQSIIFTHVVRKHVKNM